MKSFFIACLLIASGLSANAQFTEAYKAQMIKDWERAKAYTNEYLAIVPADKFNFRAHDSIRTIAQQFLHITQGIYGIGSAGIGATNPQPPRNLEQIPSAQSKDSVTYFVNASYNFVIDGLKKMSLASFDEKTKVFGRFEDPRWVFLNKAFEHQTHHRGQITVYIRLLGIKPPNEKLF